MNKFRILSALALGLALAGPAAADPVTIGWDLPTKDVDGATIAPGSLDYVTVHYGGNHPSDAQFNVDAYALGHTWDPGQCGTIAVALTVTDDQGDVSALSNIIERETGGNQWVAGCENPGAPLPPPVLPAPPGPATLALDYESSPYVMADILFVIGDATNPGGGDPTIKTKLENLGHTVTYISDEDTVGDEDYDLIVISATTSSGQINTKFNNSAVPQVNAEGFLLDDMFITGDVLDTDYGTETPGQQSFTIGPDSHPITEGYTGDVRYETVTNQDGWGDPVADAIEIAHIPGNSVRSTFFTMVEGDTLVGGGSLSQRRFVYAGWLRDNTASNWTADAQIMFERAVEWALGVDMAADAGVYTITGADVAFHHGTSMPADAGQYEIIGADAKLEYDRRLVVDAGSYAYSGADVGLARDPLAAGSGAYVITGTDVSLVTGQRLEADAGAYAIVGADIEFLHGQALVADPGAYSLVGSDAGLVRSVNLAADPGAYAYVGTDADLIKTGTALPAASGEYMIVGTKLDFYRQLRLGSDAGFYDYQGAPVVLDWSGDIPIGNKPGIAKPGSRSILSGSSRRGMTKP